VTLRGAGSNQTILSFSADNTYAFGDYLVGFIGNYDATWWNSHPGPGGANPALLVSWTGTNGVSGTYTQGATVLNLGSTPSGPPALQVGDTLFLYQNDAPGPASTLIVCAETSPTSGCAREGSSYTSGTGEHQAVKVTAINGTQVTVTPGVYAPNYASSSSPGAYWWGGAVVNAGVENLQITTSTLGPWAGVAFFESGDCWASGISVHVASGSRSGFILHLSRNITIQNSWLDPMTGGGHGSTTSYGIEPFGGTSSLILNNIIKQVDSPLMFETASEGNVVAYNYEVPGSLETGLAGHEEGFMYNLFESNDSERFRLDTYHGTMNFYTLFRNVLHGDAAYPAVDIWAYNRYGNIIANVLGTSSTATTRYQCENDFSSGQCYQYTSPSVVYRLGYGGGSNSQCEMGAVGMVCYDPFTKPSIMKWGNWDVVTGTQWNISEVPTSGTDYTNAVPTTLCTLSILCPASFIYSSKPSWWPSGKVWPAIGPDVTGGNVTGSAGHAYALPAVDCYNAASGSISNFNPATCYASSGQTSAPAPPTGLQATVQ
jgi:hypothetical protein